MPLALTYTTGTASVANGSTAVTGTGGEWLRTLRPGDFFGTHEGYMIRIASIESDEAMTLAFNWPGTALTDDPYEVVYSDDASRATAQTRDLIETMRALDVNTQGLFYEFSTSTTDSDPGIGRLRFNDGTPASVTEIYLDDIDANATGRDVTGLIGLWDVGTTVLVRSIESTAYASYQLSGVASDETGYRKLASLTYIGGDGSFVDSEAVSVSWFGVGEGLHVDAVGPFAERGDYDYEDEGFVYLSTDGDGSGGSAIYQKRAGVGEWSEGAPFEGAAGDKGWSPYFGIVSDGSRRVLRLLGYVGGTGAAPTGDINKYVSASGYTATIGDAIDIRGTKGDKGDGGDPGGIGPAGWSPVFGVVTDDDRRVLQLAGYVGGEGTPPTANVGDYVAVGGYTSTIGSAADIRGDVGGDGDPGADGTGPGVFFIWDADNADSDQGSGKAWADDDDLGVAVTVYLSKTNRGGGSVATWLAGFDDSTSDRKGILILRAESAIDEAIWDVTALADSTNYVKLTVANKSGGVTGFSASDIICVQFMPSGDKGANGDGAFNGPEESIPENFISFEDTTGTQGKDSGYGPDSFLKVEENFEDIEDANVALDNLHLQGADVASAATLDLETSTGYFVDVTGTTTTTAITLADGHERWVRAAGAWPITVGASLVLNNAGSNYTCAAGDIIHFIADGTVIRGTVFRIDGQPMATIGLSKGGTGQTTAYAGFDALTVKGSNVASATTTDIGAATGAFIHITGTTAIMGFGTKAAGVIRALVFDGALTLTHNGTSLILPGGANIVTEAGDTAVMISEGSGNWRCLTYCRASGEPVVPPQSLLAKAGGTMTGPIAFTEQSSPSTPAANTVALYSKSDGKLYFMDDTGEETEVGAASSQETTYVYDASIDFATTMALVLVESDTGLRQLTVRNNSGTATIALAVDATPAIDALGSYTLGPGEQAIIDIYDPDTPGRIQVIADEDDVAVSCWIKTTTASDPNADLNGLSVLARHTDTSGFDADYTRAMRKFYGIMDCGGVLSKSLYIGTSKAPDLEMALLDWGPGEGTATATGSPTFVAYDALDFDGSTQYLSTGRDWSDLPAITLTHVAMAVAVDGTVNGTSQAAISAGVGEIQPNRTAGVVHGFAVGTATIVTVTDATAGGFFLVSRSGSQTTTASFFHNGSVMSSVSSNVGSNLNSYEHVVGCHTGSGGPTPATTGWDGKIEFWWAGEALSSDARALLYAAWVQFKNAVDAI